MLQIMHILLWKTQSERKEVVRYLLGMLKPFMTVIAEYLVNCTVNKSLPNNSTFFTSLVTMINRVIIIDLDYFMDILRELFEQKGMQFESFVRSWFSKMEFLVSQESRKMNVIAMYLLLPKIPQHVMQEFFPEIVKNSITQLNSFLSIKLQGDDPRLYSPSKFGGASRTSQQIPRVLINLAQQSSQRFETLKKEDKLLEIDLIETFKQSLAQTK